MSRKHNLKHFHHVWVGLGKILDLALNVEIISPWVNVESIHGNYHHVLTPASLLLENSTLSSKSKSLH